MPNIPLQLLVPTAWAHWTSIAHYIVLLGTLYMLVTSGDKTPILYIAMLGFQALFIGASLYIDRVNILPIFLFLIRVGMVGVPIILAGWSPTENSRSAGVTVAIIAAPILALTFLTCTFGDPLGDPRIYNLGWC